MKLDGQNIIKDTDITLTNGNTLNNELKSFQNDIDLLKSNVKFIYKHGTLGGGSYNGGGGGGGSKSLKVAFYMQQDNGLVPIDNGSQVFYSKPGNYSIKLRLFGVTEGVQYYTEIIYNQGISKNITLSSTNDYIYTDVFNLSLNDKITINIIDSNGNEYLKLYECSYVTSIYTLTTPKIIKGYKTSNDDTFDLNSTSVVQSNNLIFIDNVKNDGIVMGFYCNFVIPPLSESSIIFTDWLGNKYNIKLTDLGISTERSSSQTIFFNLTGDNSFNSSKVIDKKTIDIKDFLSNSENAGTYEFRLEFNIKLIDSLGKQHVITDKYVTKNNLIPNDLFLMVDSSKGKLFNGIYTYDDVINCNEDEKFLLGSTILNVTPFYGQKNDSREHILSAQIHYNYNESTETFETIKQVNINNSEEISLKDQQRKQISVPLLAPGYSKIIFTLKSEGRTYYANYFLNVKNVSSNFNWLSEYKQRQIVDYPETHASFKQNYEINANDNINIYYDNKQLDALSSIIMSTNESHKFYKFDINNRNIGSIFDQLFEISIQYSKTNDVSVPIFSLNCAGSTKTTIQPNSIFVYQDKIIYTKSTTNIVNEEIRLGEISMEKNIYIPLSDTIHYDDKTLYSLLSLYKNLEFIDNNNNTRYGLYALIDGIYDSVLDSFDYNYRLFDSITFYPGNYSVNLMETICLPHSSDNDDNYYEYTKDGSTLNDIKYMNQFDIENYYYSYETLYRNIGTNISDDEQYLIKYFSEFEYDEDIKMVRCDAASAQNIADHIDIPVLLLSYMNPNVDKSVNGFIGLESWLSHSYTQEEDTGSDIPVKIYWSRSKAHGGLKEIKYNENQLDFYFNIQGSTTKGYHCKNMELYGPRSTDENTTFLYSPNVTHINDENSQEFKDMFLPEESFTLKADVVDSSHSNNNAIGAFVNDNLSEFKMAQSVYKTQNVADKYIKKIKKCLSGFPILVFLNTTYLTEDGSQENNSYYLGIYNFNLGRKSHFNLGYNKLNAVVDLIENNLEDGFVIYELNNKIERNPGVFVAEIQYNNQYFDFSQYDKSILYKIGGDDSKDALYMWDDFVNGGNITDQKLCLNKLMQCISYTGGYLFKQIGKTFSDDPSSHYGYDYWYSATDRNGNPIEQVPNFLYQMERTWNGSENVYSLSQKISADGFTTEFMDILRRTFVSTLSEEKDENNIPNVPILDYKSVSEYYTTCMAFGMIDSVEKNLNIKSWTTIDQNNPGTFYATFYDMDTALGITNTGTRMTYFSFSDYWQSVVDNDNILRPVNIIHDWAPLSSHQEDETVKFFDVPSSYLFAIAKYAPVIQRTDWTTDYPAFIDNPASLWARWRRSNGCLRNAKYFVDNYFENHLKDVPISAMNWNYKYKYFVKDSSNEGFDNVNFIKFYGTKKAYTENWLSNRLHIMDAYMNISSLQLGINEYQVLSPNENDVDKLNSDILVFREIFTNNMNEKLRYTGNGTMIFGVNSIPYSPLIVQVDSASTLYLFPANAKQYNLQVTAGMGQPQISFYGSTNWYSLSEINNFITDTHSLTINSDYFTDLLGNGGQSCNSWKLNVPAIKNISLTSKLYNGTIELNTLSAYPNLNTVNISNSSIIFKTSETGITSLIANNMQGSSIECKNVNKLTNVSLSGKFDNINIEAWQENIVLPSDGSGRFDCIDISISNTRLNNANITIYNNSTLKRIKLVDCTSLTLINCPNVEKIIIDNNEGKPTFKSLVFNGSRITGTEHIIKASNSANIETTAEGVIDLSFCNELNNLSIQNSNIIKVLLPNDCDITLPQNAFNNNPKFVGFVGNSNLYITNSNAFSRCPQFSLLQATGNKYETNMINLFVDPSCKSLKETFYIDVYLNNITVEPKLGKITYEEAKHFLTNCTIERVGNVKDITSMFEGQSIEYTTEQGLEDYNNQTCTLSLSNFVKCSSFESIFRYTKFEFSNRYMFAGGFGSQSGVDHFIYKNVISQYGRPIDVTYDFLYELIDKISELYFSQSLNIIDATFGAPPAIIELKQVFNPAGYGTTQIKYPSKLSIIQGFNVVGSYSLFNFTDIFNENWTTACTSGITLSEFCDKNTYKVEKYSTCGLNQLFYPIILNSIDNVLCYVESEDKNNELDAVNITNLFDWKNKIYKLSKIGSGGNNINPSYGFRKTLTYSNFTNICDELFGFTENNKNTQLEEIYDLFANCIIIDENNEIGDHFILVSNSNKTKQCTRITKINNMFKGLKIIDSNNNNIAIPLSWQTLYCLPNITHAIRLFANTYLKYPISFDFFHKRIKHNPINVYLDFNNTQNGNLHTYYYKQELVDIRECFANVTLYSAEAFNSEGIYNEDFEGNSIILQDYVEDQNSERYNYYYSNLSIGRTELIQPSEILDMYKAQEPEYSTYTENFIMISNTLMLLNSKNYAYDIDTKCSGTFVSPDILYGCTNNCNINSLFGYNKEITSDDKVFTGTIPEHMLYRIGNNEKFYTIETFDIRNIDLTNVFRRLNIMPIKLWETSSNGINNIYYYFVPKNFTTRQILTNTFNFRMLLPHQTDDLHEHFFLYIKDSISKDTISLNGSIPEISDQQIGIDENKYYNISNFAVDGATRYPIYFNIMADIITDNENNITNIKEGFDVSYYRSLGYDGIFTSRIMMILYGFIFKEGTINESMWKSSYLNVNSSLINIEYGGVSYNAKFFIPLKNNNYIYTGGSQNIYINKESVINNIYDNSSWNQGQYEDTDYGRIQFID